jgi:drug/metabolite transporter (DMT)-like permease
MEALAGVGANLLAQAAVLGAACSYALAGMFGRRFSQLPPLTVATGQLTASTLMLSLVVLPLEQPWALPAPSIPVIGALAGLSLLSTAIAYLLYFRILAASGATNLLLVTLLIPVSAVLLGTALLGERLASHHLFGMLLIALSLASIDGRLMQWVQSLFRSTRGQLVERNTSRL